MKYGAAKISYEIQCVKLQTEPLEFLPFTVMKQNLGVTNSGGVGSRRRSELPDRQSITKLTA